MAMMKKVVPTLAVVIAALAVLTAAPQRAWVEEIKIDGDPVMRGLPRDAIPAIETPQFVEADQATFLQNAEPVIGVSIGGEARAYPTWMLNAHEIVNDTIGNRSIAVTW
jgi:hypothetical protein